MSYVEQSLIPDEHVTYRATLSRMLFLCPIVVAALGILLLFANPGVGAVVLLAGLAWGASRYVTFTTSEFAVTNKRLIMKVGLLRRRTLEMQLGKIETVGVSQGIVGRILRYGDITVRGSGGTNESFVGIDAPMEFRKAVQVATG